MTNRTLPAGAVALVALFVTALVTSQVTAAKLMSVPLPVGLPVVGASVLLPGGAIAYPLTFFASDCYAELYGKRPAQVMVNVAFGMNFILLALVALTVGAPHGGGVPQGMFATVLGASLNIVVGSLLAYLVSQNWDVLVFHALREYTDGEALWLRNIGSTATSQALDTVIFVGLAFYVLPGAGVNPKLGLSLAGVAALMLGQYLVKLLIALVDTPFVYLVVGLVRGRNEHPVLGRY
ncbi:queuosine precursor transporter [Haloglomus salinum]|uniref:queuosine precursor transporter n=1 Tax=Haloglomus salinum TaxID=2962673 RepID=UPI0020CA114E|nr:queuosine precursor transporter [Haloglomus salinum]